ncbi:hypothetical protein XELAEV_18010870mg [Xenopus laevis]|uniref:Zinc finger protein 366 n=1 Tax=Xenopus laevis TaxID=8355 RepID=A0A974DV15_XENLA|nr:hypothetical protein XELAEV_18010870mg [Xenopus laevis]
MGGQRSSTCAPLRCTFFRSAAGVDALNYCEGAVLTRMHVSAKCRRSMLHFSCVRHIHASVQQPENIKNNSIVAPYGEQYTDPFPLYQRQTEDLHEFKEVLESSSRLQIMEEEKNFLQSRLPLMYPCSHFPAFNANMIDLCNLGIQYYRTLDHFWGRPIKQEPVMTNIMWPNGPLYLHSSYQKNYPGTMFPYHMAPQSIHTRNHFASKRLDEDALRKSSVRDSEDHKQKVEKVDVNIQIDDSFYVDIGDQKRWKCPLCDKSYTSKYNLVTHIIGHSGIKPHACTHCGKLFKQLSHLHTHMLTHQGARPHKCHVCHKAFTQTSHLKRHMMQHSQVKPYSCRVCGRGFAYPSELKVHENKHESGRENICVECGLDFPTLAQLKRHLTAHRGPVQYNCTECNKTFQYPSQLQNHMMKHKDIRPHICSECGMEFVQPHHLKQHSLIHKGVKEHKCGICGREFTLLANMKRHVLIHTNIRAYQCHLCFKSFVQKQTLKAHMIVHSDVKPFKCKLCGKAFNRMHNLLGHMHLHSDSKPFKCIYCSSKFTLKGNLTRHLKVKHGVTPRGFHSRGEGEELHLPGVILVRTTERFSSGVFSRLRMRIRVESRTLTKNSAFSFYCTGVCPGKFADRRSRNRSAPLRGSSLDNPRPVQFSADRSTDPGFQTIILFILYVGAGRGRASLFRSINLGSMEQKEPFDLSKKRRLKETLCHSDGESVKSSSSQEDKDESLNSPGIYEQDNRYPREGQHGHPSALTKSFSQKLEAATHRQKNDERISNSHQKEESHKEFSTTEMQCELPASDYSYYHNNTNTDETSNKKLKRTSNHHNNHHDHSRM